MLGYRTYFNGIKFVTDNKKRKWKQCLVIQQLHGFCEKRFADSASERRNQDLQYVKKCKECGEYFWQTEEERQWFIERKLKVPCRCYSCRKKEKNKTK